MWKAVLAGMTAVQIASSSLVLAQQMPECDSGQRWRPSPEDMSAFTDARIAALKAGLKLTPEQEKNWPAFEAAIRDMSKARAERMAAREKEQPPTDPIERLRGRAQALATAAARLTKFADAEEPLYKNSRRRAEAPLRDSVTRAAAASQNALRQLGGTRSVPPRPSRSGPRSRGLV